MVLDFLDISTTDDFAYPLDSSTSRDEGIIGSCPSFSGSNSILGEIFANSSGGSKHYSSMSRCCSDDSMSLSI
jgi:hypothetical protein